MVFRKLIYKSFLDMSLAAKATLAASCVVSVGIIGYVHLKQQLDREKLHDGVLRDVERRQRRKAENILFIEQQKDLTKKYKEYEETVEIVEKK